MTPNQIRELAALMLEELKQQKLTVVVIPDGRENSHRAIRCVVCPNPDWYSRLCQQYTAKRQSRWKRPRTIIKRWWTIKTLETISQTGVNPQLTYHSRLLDAIEFVAATRC